MNRVPDRQKQREEYLKKKRKGTLLRSIGMIALLAPLFILPLVFLFVVRWAHAGGEMLLLMGTVLLLCFMLTVNFGAQVLKFSADVLEKGNDLSELPYVPPVTLDTLPAEEVLVRGAAQPSATSATLLRPVTDDVQTPAEQLLRATNGAGSEQP